MSLIRVIALDVVVLGVVALNLVRLRFWCWLMLVRSS